jgi:hypothetical protein
MTTPEIAPPKDRWLRAIGYGLLAEIATILTIVAVVLLYKFVFARGMSDADYVAFAARWGAILGVVGGTLYVYLFAHLLMRRLSSRFVAHGVVVAIAAILLSVAGSLAGHQGLPPAYLLASALKLIAGGLAVTIASKRAHLTS